MAVIQAVPGLTVNVKVAGQIATEYAAPEEEASGDQADTSSVPQTTCYIESTSGLAFGVQTAVAPEFEHFAPYDSLLLRVYIDGQYVAGVAHSKHKINLKRPFIHEISSAITASDRKGFANTRNFTFTPVSSVEEVARARIAQDTKTASSLGVIRLTATLGYGMTTIAYTGADVRDNRTLELAEKAMKGKELSHGTSFPVGAFVALPSAESFKREHKLCDFILKYRSRGALEREFVIPLSPASTPVLDEIDGLSDLEVRRLAREMLRVKRENRRSERGVTVKRERDATDRAGPARELKMVRLGDGNEAVDLTDD